MRAWYFVELRGSEAKDKAERERVEMRCMIIGEMAFFYGGSAAGRREWDMGHGTDMRYPFLYTNANRIYLSSDYYRRCAFQINDEVNST